MPNPFVHNREFQAALRARDAAALKALRGAYQPIVSRFLSDVSRTLAETASDSRAFRLSRLLALLDGLETELNSFAFVAGSLVTDAQRLSVHAAVEQMRALVVDALGDPPPGGAAVIGNLTAFPSDAARAMIGLAGDGSPLDKLLSPIAPETSRAVREALVAGIAAGDGADAIAAKIQPHLGEGLVRASRIARTETMRAYNESARMYLHDNDDVCAGWYWSCARSVRTCIVCWEMDGSFHSIDEPFASHVCCRCSSVPAVRSWAELGFPGYESETYQPKPARESFHALTADQQRAILGPGKYEAWKSGRFSLADLVGEGRSEAWGPYRYERSLKDTLARPKGGKGADMRVPL